VGISFASLEGARENLKAEMPGWDFEKVYKQAQAEWEKELSAITVTDKNKTNKTIFYTALYHSLLNPNTFSDVDGSYMGMDDKVHKADHPVYTVFSLWDTFRAEHPLFTIVDRKRALDMVKTLILKYEESGLLPVWELAGWETGTMIGYHSIPVIVDAYFNGIQNFNVEEAYKAMKNSAMQDKLGLKYYKEMGFIPADLESEAASKTLEYAYDDWCIAMMAKALGKEDDYNYFIARAKNYSNLFDPEYSLMRAKKNGAWVVPFDPYAVSGYYTEANAWQYSFFTPQDVNGLINLMGGEKAFASKLDELFTTDSKLTGRHQSDITGLIGQYAHGNEPSHHAIYLYNFAGEPWKTQQRVHQTLTTLYTDKPDGLSGNEDCGQMSAWYVLSSMGVD
jgi:predicted alpha-1,2-mannosidase